MSKMMAKQLFLLVNKCYIRWLEKPACRMRASVTTITWYVKWLCLCVIQIGYEMWPLKAISIYFELSFLVIYKISRKAELQIC